MSGAFRDFIPAGEDTGAQGNGFKDFVPTPVPVFHSEPVEEKVVEVKEKSNKELRNEAIALGIDVKNLTNKEKLIAAIAKYKEESLSPVTSGEEVVEPTVESTEEAVEKGKFI